MVTWIGRRRLRSPLIWVGRPISWTVRCRLHAGRRWCGCRHFESNSWGLMAVNMQTEGWCKSISAKIVLINGFSVISGLKITAQSIWQVLVLSLQALQMRPTIVCVRTFWHRSIDWLSKQNFVICHCFDWLFRPSKCINHLVENSINRSRNDFTNSSNALEAFVHTSNFSSHNHTAPTTIDKAHASHLSTFNIH